MKVKVIAQFADSMDSLEYMVWTFITRFDPPNRPEVHDIKCAVSKARMPVPGVKRRPFSPFMVRQ